MKTIKTGDVCVVKKDIDYYGNGSCIITQGTPVLVRRVYKSDYGCGIVEYRKGDIPMVYFSRNEIAKIGAL